jgi:hypothetical protein
MTIETGAAELKIVLEAGQILVYHASGELLAIKNDAPTGSWDKLIDVLKDDIGCKWLVAD